MSPITAQLTDEFVSLLSDYSTSKEEVVLQRAYELGRNAVRANLTVLEMVAIHQDALVKFLLNMLASDEIAAVTKSAADLFAESLAPFELAQRSFREGTDILRNLKEALESRVAEQTEEIRREKDFAQKLVETAPVIILVLDKDGRVIQYNPFMESVSGYPLAEIQGQEWFSIFLPEADRDVIRELFLRVLSGTDKGGINPILTKDGRERMIEWSCTALKDTAESPVGVLCLGQDITDKARLQEQLVEKERLAVMSVTAAKLIHEIGNPLNGIYITSQLLERQFRQAGITDEKSLATFQTIVKEIQRLNTLLSDFRSLYRDGRYHLQPLSLAQLVGELLDVEGTGYAGRGIHVESFLPADLPLVIADQDKLKQALLNLCKNAAEAMPQGGTLTLRANQSAGELVVEVADTGGGIAKGVDIWEPFKTTKSLGTGLGLVIVRQIIAAHGGTITYESETGKGTTFRLSLPLKPAE